MHTIKFCSILFSIYKSTDKNDVDARCYQHDSTIVACLQHCTAQVLIHYVLFCRDYLLL